MSGASDSGLYHEIARLNDDFGYALDHGDLALYLSLFTPDVDYRSGARHLQGRDALRAFFETRRASGRQSRHFWCGLRLSEAAGDSLTGYSLWQTFAKDADAPDAAYQPPMVADVHDRYRLIDGHWRIAWRQISPVFAAAAGSTK